MRLYHSLSYVRGPRHKASANPRTVQDHLEPTGVFRVVPQSLGHSSQHMNWTTSYEHMLYIDIEILTVQVEK